MLADISDMSESLHESCKLGIVARLYHLCSCRYRVGLVTSPEDFIEGHELRTCIEHVP